MYSVSRSVYHYCYTTILLLLFFTGVQLLVAPSGGYMYTVENVIHLFDITTRCDGFVDSTSFVLYTEDVNPRMKF